MLKVVKDGAGGTHDMMIAAWTRRATSFFGHKGPHASCAENLTVSMHRLGFAIRWSRSPSISSPTRHRARRRLLSPPNPVPPGAYVELEALMDLICVVSSCPFDLPVEGWTINARAARRSWF